MTTIIHVFNIIADVMRDVSFIWWMLRGYPMLYIYETRYFWNFFTPSPNATLEPVYNTTAAFNAIDTYQIFLYG